LRHTEKAPERKMTILTRPLCMSLLAGALVGCIDFSGSNSAGGGGGNFESGGGPAPVAPGDLCSPVAGGSSRLSIDTTLCPGCTVDNPNAAFDGQLPTTATLNFTPAGQISLSGQVQTGTVLPGGSIGGIALQLAQGATVALTVTTLLDGVPTVSCLTLLRTPTTSSDSVGVNCNLVSRPGQPSFYGVSSPVPYNTIRVDLDYGDDGLENPVPVFELCVR
jgi:hypothetical protein